MSYNPFVVCAVVLNLGASIWYVVKGQYLLAVYWFAAFQINGTVLLMGGK